jgi:hypothetical protein
MTELGFRKLTADNWLLPDEASSMFFGASSADGQFRPMKGEDWLRPILQPQLNDTVPFEVRRLYEVARGALAYGYLFYPLYTLAAEQLFRVAEAAVTHKCKAVGAPNSIRSFQPKVDYLVNQGIISAEDKSRWDAIRKLRNIASHPENQTILPPGPVIGLLERITDSINSLFPQ